ncbi:pyridoxamine 5'-phosphate oxidase family protein [Allonocardiopsis opalescens]|uniref:Pyridoxamine 5'-phosphate oxidase n=1 Tax=Allonocardiopsis opalescens TaxID=1144618 RepID=A0A2T0Q4F8_9ACTN|nr:pyridoxamine 5'-phosphate oxidase family protein [Allonocardiopsis opalescens]PRX98682.1 pyridoxamine 5'-phosphate oxidase [Allonocardiopsis opalescens]
MTSDHPHPAEQDPTSALADTARAIIDANRYLALGTADRTGSPWTTPVFFAHHEYRDFLWISAPGAAHSRNIAERAEVSAVVFDSGVAPGTGQAVYMAASAAEETDLDRWLALYPGAPERGGRTFPAEQVRPPAPYRLYRARVTQHWTLCPRDPGTACAPHGLAGDHRVRVAPI